MNLSLKLGQPTVFAYRFNAGRRARVPSWLAAFLAEQRDGR
jgi:hypothetical protein